MSRADTATANPIAARVFHRLVRDPEAGGGERRALRDEAFADALGSTERFFARLPSLSPERKGVLDYGCGIGATPIWVAEHGARRAVGIDIQNVQAADDILEHDYPHLRDRVSYRQVRPGYDVGDERFDLVISKDTFEHVDDPDEYVRAMARHLAPGGQIAIGFGPLWKSPWGGHIDYMTRMPWAHLIFPERVILAERRRFRPDESPSRFEDVRGGLNRMTLGRFLETMERSGLECRYLATNQAESARSIPRRAFIGAVRIASLIPLLREYGALNVYSVWGHPQPPIRPERAMR